MLSSHCHNCGQSKNPAEYALNQCGTCTALNNEAQQHAKVENPALTNDQLLYIGRMAMQQRALHRGSSYMDPRQFSGRNSMIPVPPQSGDRGAPGV